MTRFGTGMNVLVSDCGDAAVRVIFASAGRDHAWRSAHRLSSWLDAHRQRHHLRGLIATYDAVLVEFDPSRTDHGIVRSLIDIALSSGEVAVGRPPRHFDVPVIYGGSHGPDLQRVADQQGISADEVIALHSARPLTMRCYGSPGGAPMLDGPSFPHPVPRLASPRPHVPAGAVAVAGRQAVVSARPAPGGWCVIGQTPRQLIDLDRTPFISYAPGDTFSFFPITADEWASFEGGLTGPAEGSLDPAEGALSAGRDSVAAVNGSSSPAEGRLNAAEGRLNAVEGPLRLSYA